ncbi:uncharacterized protein BCN122_I0888 [Burkholderia cenocepacia]|nr:uncharacterized protein BCN122_I0888 [Burkholderia cenocepacia]
MPHLDKCFGEVGHHSLGTAVQFRGHRFMQRSDLGDSHA